MTDTEAAAIIATVQAHAGYTIIRAQDNTGQAIIHIDGPNGWYAEIGPKELAQWLRNAVANHIQNGT